MFFLDEAWFTAGHNANIQNNEHWSSENPPALHEAPVHDLEVGVLECSNCTKNYRLLWFLKLQ